MNKKEIIKALQSKKLNPFYYNDALYEAVYCSIVQHNDTIREIKENIKAWRQEKPRSNGAEYGGALYIAQKIADLKSELKEYRKKRRELQKASALLLGDGFYEYDD